MKNSFKLAATVSRELSDIPTQHGLVFQFIVSNLNLTELLWRTCLPKALLIHMF